MHTEQSLAIMKALADRSRLAIVNSLLERSHYVEELAQRHALAPSTVSFHLRKLEQAGLVASRKEQYYVVVAANDAIFATTLRQIVAATPAGRELQDGRLEEYRRKVLESFFRHGRLEKLPAQHKKRLIVLEEFVLRFAPGRRYGEAEVTGLIVPLCDDYCTIRRLLVDEKLIRREGMIYWREGTAGAQTGPPTETQPKEKERTAMPKTTNRAELKRLHQQNVPAMGIYQIRNMENGKIYLGSSQNLEGTRNSRLFQLRMGKVVFNRDLQQDLTRYGAENFDFSVVDVLGKTEPGDNIEQLLAALELHWLAKLQPFGERGYNSLKAYQRSVGRLQQQNGVELA